jgi:hypothetical protein
MHSAIAKTQVRAIRTAIVCISLGTAACAVHPLPEDVTGVSTVAIVNKIRCEAAEAVQQSWRSFKDTLGDTDRKIFDRAAIAYSFTFDITETNNVDATLDLTKIITNGTATASPTAGMDRTRRNIRQFTVIDHFGDLKGRTDCPQFATAKNYIYPIVGRIGVGEMTDTFVALTFFGKLADDPASSSLPKPLGAGTPATMVDQLTFTTTIQSSVTPTITLTPVGPALQVAGGHVGITANRMDQHEVIVALAVDTTGITAPIGTAARAEFRAEMAAGPQTNVGTWITIHGHNRADYLAAHAIEQTITRFDIARRRNGLAIAIVP